MADLTEIINSAEQVLNDPKLKQLQQQGESSPGYSPVTLPAQQPNVAAQVAAPVAAPASTGQPPVVAEQPTVATEQPPVQQQVTQAPMDFESALASAGITIAPPVQSSSSGVADAPPVQSSSSGDADFESRLQEAGITVAPPVGQQTTSQDQSQEQDVPSETGILDQFGSGINEGLASILGMPVDYATMGLNAGAGAINSIFGTELGQITNPVGGSQFFEETIFDPFISDVEPETAAQRYTRRAGRAVGSSVVPAGVAARSGQLGARTLGNILATELGAEMGGQVASDVSGDNPYAELAGTILGAFAPSTASRSASRIAEILRGQGLAGSTIRRIVRDVNKALPKDAPKISEEEVIQSVLSGQGVPAYLSRRDEISDSVIENITNRIAKDSTPLLDDMKTTAERRISRMGLDLEKERSVAGANVGRARDAMSQEEVKGILSDLISQTNAGNSIINSAIKPVVRTRLLSQDDLVEGLGYKHGNLPDIDVDKSTGQIYLVKANKEGKPFARPKSGEYDKDKLVPYDDLTGADLDSIRTTMTNPIRRDLTDSEYADNVSAFKRVETPNRLTELMNENEDLNRANRIFEDVIRRQEAVSASASGRKSYVDYTERIDQSDLPEDYKDTLKFLAREVNILNSIGRRANAAKGTKPAAKLLDDLSFGTMLGRSLQATLKYAGINYLRNKIFQSKSLNSLSRSDRKLLPLMRHLINADNPQMNAMLEEMMRRGVKTNKDFEEFLRAYAVTIGSSETLNNSGSDDQISNELLDSLGAR